MPLVSVVTPAFNAAATLRATLASVSAQTTGDWEHLVVDDGSGDETLALLRDAARDEPRLRVLTLPVNSGAAAARNAALREARGRFVAFLDSDDRWLPAKLEAQLRFHRESGVGLSYGSYRIAPAGGAAPRRLFRPPPSLTHAELLRGCPIGCSTVMIDTAQTGPLSMPLLRRGQDWALWLALARGGVTLRRFPGVHTVYTTRRGSLSSNKLRKLADVMRVYRAAEGLGRVHSGALVARHAFYVLWRKRRDTRHAELEDERL